MNTVQIKPRIKKKELNGYLKNELPHGSLTPTTGLDTIQTKLLPNKAVNNKICAVLVTQLMLNTWLIKAMNIDKMSYTSSTI